MDLSLTDITHRPTSYLARIIQALYSIFYYFVFLLWIQPKTIDINVPLIAWNTSSYILFSFHSAGYNTLTTSLHYPRFYALQRCCCLLLIPNYRADNAQGNVKRYTQRSFTYILMLCNKVLHQQWLWHVCLMKGYGLKMFLQERL